MSNSYQYAHDSYYCYKNSNVLKNKLGIRNSDILEEKELSQPAAVPFNLLFFLFSCTNSLKSTTHTAS